MKANDRSAGQQEFERLLSLGEGKTSPLPDLNLQGVRISEARAEPGRTIGGLVVTQMKDIVHLRDRKLLRANFAASHLRGLRLHGCTFERCSFDQADCRDWRVWATSFVDCSFRESNLRAAVLGGVEGDVASRYERVDFTDADLRGTIYTAAAFVGCRFVDSRIEDVDFKGSAFVDCIFAGEIKNAIFRSQVPSVAGVPRNEMLNADFSKAKLRNVEFRGLSLESMRPPEDRDHEVIQDYGAWIQAQLAQLGSRDDLLAVGLRAYLEATRRSLGDAPSVGIINKRDVLALFGPEGLEALGLV